MRRAYNLIETVVVIAIIGLMLGLLLSAVHRVRASMHKGACASQLRELGLALQNHVATHGRYPTARGRHPFPSPEHFFGWHVWTLPFLGQNTVYNETLEASRSKGGFSFGASYPHYATIIRIYVCPADPRLLKTHQVDGADLAFSSYLGVKGTGESSSKHIPREGLLKGVFGSKPGIQPVEIVDGSSQTVMIGERPPPANFVAGNWHFSFLTAQLSGPSGSILIPHLPVNFEDARPCEKPTPFVFGPGTLENICDRRHLWSQHPGQGANFAFADGSVRFLGYGLGYRLADLASIAGHEDQLEYD
jgi:prepilin-type processing-associated H-X9-DG protein